MQAEPHVETKNLQAEPRVETKDLQVEPRVETKPHVEPRVETKKPQVKMYPDQDETMFGSPADFNYITFGMLKLAIVVRGCRALLDDEIPVYGVLQYACIIVCVEMLKYPAFIFTSVCRCLYRIVMKNLIRHF